jgi:uncharacterized protein (TIGR02145 family)
MENYEYYLEELATGEKNVAYDVYLDLLKRMADDFVKKDTVPIEDEIKRLEAELEKQIPKNNKLSEEIRQREEQRQREENERQQRLKREEDERQRQWQREENERQQRLRREEDERQRLEQEHREKEVQLNSGTFTDLRDGRVYKTIKIGTQVWMAENLNYEVKGFFGSEKSKCYDNDPKNAEKYGRLYYYHAAKEAVPPGWHLPTIEEWKTLIAFMGDNADRKLKATNGWSPNNGTDFYGFTALPSGRGSSDGSYWFSSNGFWWSDSAYTYQSDAQTHVINYSVYYCEIDSNDGVRTTSTGNTRDWGDRLEHKEDLFSVRCVEGAKKKKYETKKKKYETKCAIFGMITSSLLSLFLIDNISFVVAIISALIGWYIGGYIGDKFLDSK